MGTEKNRTDKEWIWNGWGTDMEQIWSGYGTGTRTLVEWKQNVFCQGVPC